MAIRLGTGYKGSSEIQKSTGNQEIIPPKEEGWTHGYNFYKFSFKNNQPCVVKINGGEPIYIEGGFTMSEIDSPIWSFVVVDPFIDFFWLGAY